MSLLRTTRSPTGWPPGPRLRRVMTSASSPATARPSARPPRAPCSRPDRGADARPRPKDHTVLAWHLMEPRRSVRFTGRRALVTGAGSGIGHAVARKLHEEGADVVLADVRSGPVETTADELGERATAIELDVRDEDSVRDVARGVDVLANVAGIGSTTAAPETSLAVWEDVFAVNARGTFLCCKHAIPGMVERGGGSIVNVASVGGVVALRNRAAYCASKGAVIAFTRAAAVDHVGAGVRVNAVCPGTVDTPWVRRLVEDVGESLDGLRARQLMGRLGTPDEVAAAVCYLASDDAAFVTGTALVIDGGLSAA